MSKGFYCQYWADHLFESGVCKFCGLSQDSSAGGNLGRGAGNAQEPRPASPTPAGETSTAQADRCSPESLPLMVKYLEGKKLSHNELEILMFALYIESEKNNGIAKRAQQNLANAPRHTYESSR